MKRQRARGFGGEGVGEGASVPNAAERLCTD